MDPTLFYAVVGALLGAALGSYLGALAWRLPRHRSLLERSHCPGCGQPVPAHLNVPVVAFLLLRGRAACCGTPLSSWYLILESGTAAVGALVGGLLRLPGLLALALVIVLGSLAAKALSDRRFTR